MFGRTIYEREGITNGKKKPWINTGRGSQKLGVSQAYFSLFEKGKRPVTGKLSKKAVHLFKMPPTALPLEKELKNVRPATNEKFVKRLAAYTYPGYTHVKASRLKIRLKS